MNRINLGDKVRDRVVGLSGIVTSRTEYLFGCVRIQVQPQSKGGKAADSFTTDEPQVELVKAGVITPIAPLEETARTHGDRPDSVARRDVSTRPGAVPR